MLFGLYSRFLHKNTSIACISIKIQMKHLSTCDKFKYGANIYTILYYSIECKTLHHLVAGRRRFEDYIRYFISVRLIVILLYLYLIYLTSCVLHVS